MPPGGRTPPRGLVVSVGGSARPILASIAEQRPEKLVFFVSPQSAGRLKEDVIALLPEGYRPEWRQIQTPSAELLDDSYRALVELLPRLIADLGLDWSEIRADFTGGTKAMSAALVLALVDRGCEFSYVGASDDPLAREKGGLGIVVDGKERLVLTGDPWQEVAAARLRSACLLFGDGRLDAAVAALPEPPPRGRVGALTRSLRPLFEAFREWDRQRYEVAFRRYRAGLEAFELLAEGAGDPSMLEYLKQVRDAGAKLERVVQELAALTSFKPGAPRPFEGVDGRGIPADLCAAAARHARQGGDPEDGVLLLYAAVEKHAKATLIVRYGIDNSQFPVAELGTLASKYEGNARSGFAEVPLQDSYRVLAERGDAAGLRFASRLDTLRKLQSARNHSWREHGYRHVEARVFEDLFPQVLDFLGFAPEELVTFPWPRFT